RVAGASALGGLVGGFGAARVGAAWSPAFLLVVLSGVIHLAGAGALLVGRGMPSRPREPEPERPRGGWAETRRTPLLRSLASVVVLAAVLAALADYWLKADAVAYYGRGEHLVRFFGLFYGGTSIAAFLLQATLGRVVLARLGLDGSVASHPAVVGVASVVGLVTPPPGRSPFPRALAGSLPAPPYRAGYELLYTPLPEGAKRSAKSVVDVAADALGKSAGAAAILLLATVAGRNVLPAVDVALVVVAAAEFVAARRLRGHYVRA